MNIALILAGGTGSRIGADIPKQYIKVAGQPIIAYCLQTFEKHDQIDAIWVVAEKEWHSLIREWSGEKVQGFSKPGANRQLSILNGLKGIRNWASDEDVVIIHDAARPLVSMEMITDCLEACVTHEGVMPAIPVKDTVYYGVDGRIESLLERSRIVAGQAPEAFRLGVYYQANIALSEEQMMRINGSTEPAVMAGMDVCYIAGDEQNFKVTTAEDLKRFIQIVETAEGEK